jgi:hypothetical protein
MAVGRLKILTVGNVEIYGNGDVCSCQRHSLPHGKKT